MLERQQVACHCGTQAAAAAVSTMLWHSARNLQFSTSSQNERRWCQELGLQGFGSGEKRINPSSPCQTLSFFSFFLPSVLKAQSLRSVVLNAKPHYRVVQQVLGDRELPYESVPLIHPI